MSYLLDTCIISKLRKNKTESSPLAEWIASRAERYYFLSVFTVGEIQMGISKLSSQKPEEKRKKMVYEDWLLNELVPRFKDRILPFDNHTASIWGTMKDEALKTGLNLPVIDSLIAATAIQYNLTLVTENIKDFSETGARLLNPYVI